MSVTLTPAAGKLLGYFQQRTSMGCMYVAYAARARYAVVVPELSDDGPLARIDATSRDSVAALEQAGLIELGPMQDVEYRYRRHLDDFRGHLVTLTRLGKATCRVCGSQGDLEHCLTRSGRDHQARLR